MSDGPTERLVYTQHARAPKPVHLRKRKRRGDRECFQTPDGKWHLYLNMGVPDCGPITDSICIRCGHGYAENVVNGTCTCSECRGEDLMERAEFLEAQGVELGASGPDRIQQRMAYGFRDPLSATLRW